MAMSYAFGGDCANAVKYEEMAIAYWATREQAEPQNAFFEEGELANETAGSASTRGTSPPPSGGIGEEASSVSRSRSPGPTRRASGISAWPTRWAGSPRGGATRPKRRARSRRRKKLLDADNRAGAAAGALLPLSHRLRRALHQRSPTAEAELTRALAMPGNQNDPFMNCLLAMTYDKQGKALKAIALYQKAYDLATGHNPPAAFVRPFVRQKLAP